MERAKRTQIWLPEECHGLYICILMESCKSQALQCAPHAGCGWLLQCAGLQCTQRHMKMTSDVVLVRR